MSAPKLEIKWLPHGHGLDAPSYESAQAAGMDIRAALAQGETLVLTPGRAGHGANRFCNGAAAGL
jgi:dUTP pyrophosphatase